MVMKHTLKHLILFFCIWNIANTSSTGIEDNGWKSFSTICI